MPSGSLPSIHSLNMHLLHNLSKHLLIIGETKMAKLRMGGKTWDFKFWTLLFSDA